MSLASVATHHRECDAEDVKLLPRKKAAMHTHTLTSDSVEELVVIAHFLLSKPTNRHRADVGLLAHVPVGGSPLCSYVKVLAAVPPSRLAQGRRSDFQGEDGGTKRF